MTINRLEASNHLYSSTKTQTLTVHSSHLNRRCDISIYNANSDSANLPVIILLHGVYGNHWVWMQLGGVHLVYEKMRAQGLSEFVLVMPSDGGFYDGSAYLPLKEGGNYDRWIMEDVINAVKQTQSSVTEESHWYITGLSMGGYGALRLGSKYATVFSGISGHSSISKIEDMSEFVNEELALYECDTAYENDILHWCKIHANVLPPLRFDCGKDDVLYQSNLIFTNELMAIGIEHEFESLEGAHEWEYWHHNIEKTFTFFDRIENP